VITGWILCSVCRGARGIFVNRFFSFLALVSFMSRLLSKQKQYAWNSIHQ